MLTLSWKMVIWPATVTFKITAKLSHYLIWCKSKSPFIPLFVLSQTSLCKMNPCALKKCMIKGLFVCAVNHHKNQVSASKLLILQEMHLEKLKRCFLFDLNIIKYQNLSCKLMKCPINNIFYTYCHSWW